MKSQNWNFVVLVSVLIISMSSCTAWVEGKRAETVCERAGR